ncbi:MAG: ABC transporter ATP-binding protein [Thermoguttaceae bacterium]
MLKVEGIGKDYLVRGETITVLNDCSFALEEGESLAVLGPSGSGKSTLLSILGTLETPSRGTFELGGQSPLGMKEAELARFRREKIGFIFQDHHLLPQCTALENVLIPFLADSSITPDQEKYGREILAKVGLEHRLEHRPGELSGGEKQRVAIARSLIRQPLLILADEPTGNLDRANALAVADILCSLVQSNLILVLATHDLELAGKMKSHKKLGS